jgi:DNA-directed RNA polymerase specialized sigma24 family protein
LTTRIARADRGGNEPFRELDRIEKVTLRLVSESAGEHGQEDLADAALLSRVAVADPDALAALYQRHGTACYRLARHITASHDLAQDAVQEAFIGMWKSPASYHGGRGSVRTWLLGLTHQALDPPSLAADPAAAAWDGIRAAEVRAALTELPEAQKQALALAYFGGYTQSQIAELTGVPLGTVKTRTFSAMRRLRLRLAPLASVPREGHRD